MEDRTLIQIEGLRRSYPEFSLGPVSLSLCTNEILGLVGRNGAGKSTLLRSILGLVQVEAGSIALAPSLLQRHGEHRSVIGYISDRPVFYEWMTADRAIRFYSNFYSNWNSSRVQQIVSTLQLNIHKRIADLSTGNRLKLALLLCLCQGAQVLVLDEPTSGLDPIVRDDLLKLIRRSLDDGWVKAVIFASHVLTEVSAIATRVVVLHNGQIVDEFNMQNLSTSSTQQTTSSADTFSERCLEAMR